ncbi:MAG: FAD-binding oxidoreductase [candidate division Zixibacteria bacterium]|nr:FAD-binding oxidoreductase [candidate division Zixibacteria bacterium]
MNSLNEISHLVNSEFPDDRLTFQKGVAVFHPENAAEAARFFKLAGQLGRKVFISGYGNNIDPVGATFENLLVVKTDRLNSVIAVVEQDLYVTVGGGYPLNEINAQLKRHNLFVPHADLPYAGSAGGAVAINLAAELNGHDLPLKKYFIKAEIVTPAGEILTPGSVCFKSVSGYDIVKIFAASWGLLGLIATVTFRTIPLSAIEEFAAMKMKAIDRKNFLKGLDASDGSADAVYSRKIKDKFDPDGLLPIV